MRSLIVLCVLVSGCSTYKAEKLGAYKTSSDYSAVETKNTAEVDDLKAKIKDLEERLQTYKDEDARGWTRIRELEAKNCGHGDVEAGGSNYPVATFDNPFLVLARMDREYLENNPGASAERKEPVVVKKIKMPSGKRYPDVVCFDFEDGAQTCFDPMEITER